MSKTTNYLDAFFNKFPLPDASGLHIRPLVSNCCDANMFSEPFNMPGTLTVFGRCDQCKEIAEFMEENDG